MRALILDEEIGVNGYDGKFTRWLLFGGKKETLWTSYTAEPDTALSTGFVTASLPTLTVQVVDFSKPFYSTIQGRKKIDAVAVEIARLREVRSENVLKVYGVKRDKSPKGWERLIILVERVGEGLRLRSWLPSEGLGESVARVSVVGLKLAYVLCLLRTTSHKSLPDWPRSTATAQLRRVRISAKMYKSDAEICFRARL